MSAAHRSTLDHLRRANRRSYGYYPISAVSLLFILLHPDTGMVHMLLCLGVTWTLVAIHELGHASAAKAAGYDVTGLRAYPVFGITRISGLRQVGSDRFRYLITVCAGPLAGALAALMGVFTLSVLKGAGTVPTGWPHTAYQLTLLAGLADQLLNLLPIHQALDGAKALDTYRCIRRRRPRSRGVARPAYPLASHDFPIGRARSGPLLQDVLVRTGDRPAAPVAEQKDDPARIRTAA